MKNRLYAIYELLGGIVAFAFYYVFADLVYINWKRIKQKKRLCIKRAVLGLVLFYSMVC